MLHGRHQIRQVPRVPGRLLGVKKKVREMLLIHRSTDTPIRPRDVESETAFVKAFGKRESEVAAYWIVRYCQSKRSWLPFDFDKLVRFCQAHDPAHTRIYNYLLEGVSELVVGGFVVSEKRVVTLTTSFVARCYGAAPVPGLPRMRRPRVKRSQARRLHERLIDDADLV